MNVRALAVPVIVLFVLALSACGDSEKEEGEYVDAVAEAWALSHARFASFSETMDMVWNTTGELFRALVEEGAGTAYDGTLEAILNIDPPDRYRDAHETMTARLRELADVNQGIGRAAADNDLDGFVSGNSALFRTLSLLLFALPSELCRGVQAEPTPQCDHPGSIPGGDYGDKLHRIMGTFEAEFASRTRQVFIPALAVDEAPAIFAGLKPEVVAIVEKAILEVSQLDPPNEFRTDHDRLLQYFEEVLEEANAFSPLPSTQNISAIPPRPDLDDTPQCSARSELSDAIEPIVRFHFWPYPTFCGAPPTDVAPPP